MSEARVIIPVSRSIYDNEQYMAGPMTEKARAAIERKAFADVGEDAQIGPVELVDVRNKCTLSSTDEDGKVTELHLHRYNMVALMFAAEVTAA